LPRRHRTSRPTPSVSRSDSRWQRATVAQRDRSDGESPRIPFGHAGAGIERGVRARE
jgi:hypothetical protein